MLVRAASVSFALALGACCSVGGARASHTEEDYAEALAKVRGDAPPEHTTLIVPPFVVTGDGAPEAVRQDAAEVVGWAYALLKKDYFPLEPGTIVSVWLFGSSDSYERNASAIFHDYPSTPYGYYSPCHHALIMNVSTGYGTLVHEMVHPLMAANFPEAPPWFDEGLASLFEAPSEKDGHLYGETNWRLPGLQRAIERGTVKPLREVAEMGRFSFYGKDAGLHYAEARYLLHYLQEKGLLRDYFRAFKANVGRDSSGYATLRALLHEPDDASLDAHFRAYAAGLIVKPRAP